MIHKFKDKKGNLTALLVMIIAFMILMTAILAKRMSSHTQLLTLSDYTQISRYFLESYIGEVMQKVRHEVSQPNSSLAQEICKNIEEINPNLTPLLHYSPSSALKDLAKSYGNEIKIKESDFQIELIDKEDNSDDNDIGALPYPDKINPGPQKGKEKKGVIQITCKCEFMKREYTLVVQYPFTVVYRMTPILKDFMLFVDNLYDEQNEYNSIYYNSDTRTKNNNMDTLNILSVKTGQLLDESNIPPNIRDHNNSKLPNFGLMNGDKFRPLALQLMYDDDNGRIDLVEISKKTGMVYLGPTDVTLKNSIYLNLAGTTLYYKDPESTKHIYNFKDISVINPQYFEMDLSDVTKQSFGLDNNFYSFLTNYPLLTMDNRDSANQWLKFGYVGFSNEMPELFEGSHYDLEEFLGDDLNLIKNTYWGGIYNNPKDFISYSSGLKLFSNSMFNTNEDYLEDQYGEFPEGNFASPTRQIFGNVFGRFFVFSFFHCHDGAEVPLKYQPTSTISEYNENNREEFIEKGLLSPEYVRSDEERKTMYDLRPKYPEGLSEYEQDRFYQKLMSKIISGMPAYDKTNNEQNYLKDGNGTHQFLFMPLNFDFDPSVNKNKVFDERDFAPCDGFLLADSSADKDNPNQFNAYHFDDFGKDWFNPEDTNASAAVEARIGRSFIDSFDGSKSAQDKFKEAVGYPNKFIINGVVYVGGDLDLDKDMDLKPGDCSGGVVLVDGNITLPNITRGEKIENISMNKVFVGDNSYYSHWTNPNSNSYIATDSIITFVCLKNPNKQDPKITAMCYLAYNLLI